MFNKNSWTQDILVSALPPVINSLVQSGTYNSGNLTLVGGSGVSFTTPILVEITSSADESANLFTITGINANGNVKTETLYGSNANTVVAQTPFYKVISISQSMNNNGSIQIGNAAQTATAWVPLDKNSEQFAVEFGVGLSPSASLTYTLQFALISTVLNTQIIQNDSILDSQSSSGTSYLSYEPFDAARIYLNSYTSGNAVFMVRPSGLGHAGVPSVNY